MYRVCYFEINLNTVAGIASFKRFVEDVVIPHLKTNILLAGNNTFIQNLIPYANISGDRVNSVSEIYSIFYFFCVT